MVSLSLPQSALQNWLRPDRSAQVARVVNILLVIWLAWLLAGLSWLVLPEPESQPGPTLTGAPVPVPTSKPRVDERQIAAWHVFGEAGADKPAQKVAAVEAPETSLKLTLRGVFASDDPKDARAIIGDPRGQEKHYAVGDPLPGGAKLSEIYPDRIILERNGRYETLRLPRELTSSVVRGNGSTVQSPATSSASNRAAAFNRYRSELRQNPAAFLNYVRATPHRGNDGKFMGFQLRPGPKRGALKELGLQPGDIVTAINGVQIDSPAKGMKAMQALGEGANVNVTLLRGGRETSLSFTVPSAK